MSLNVDCYFSPKCKFSNDLLQKLKSNEILHKSTTFININEMKTLPPFLKQTPTLVLNKENIIVGKDIIDFVNKSKESSVNAFDDNGGFSFLGNEDSTFQSSTSFSDINENISINTSEDEVNNSSDDKRLEQLIQQRSLEI